MPSCGQKCSDIGCNPAVGIDLPLPQVDWTTLHSYSVRVCRNTTCATGTFADLPATGENGSGYGVMLSGWPADEVITAFVQWPGTFRVQVQDGKFKNGDRYTITVTDATGATAASFDKAATYTQAEAGGDSCGLLCTKATFN